MRFSPLLFSFLTLTSFAATARAQQRLNPPQSPDTRASEEPPGDQPPGDEAERVEEGPDALVFTTDDPALELRLPNGTRLVPKQSITFRHIEYSTLERKPKFETACIGPCTLHVSPGTYRMALGKADGDSVEGDAAVEIEGPSRIHGELTDRSAVRTVGAVIGVAGVVGGLGLVAAASEMQGDSAPSYFTAGLVTLGVGGAIAVILLLQSDHAHFTVTPLVGGAHEGMLPRGAAFTYVF